MISVTASGETCVKLLFITIGAVAGLRNGDCHVKCGNAK